jgi:gliding motility-associated-like protein
MYTFEFFLSSAEASRYAVSGMGAYISDTKLRYEDYDTPAEYQDLFKIQPQIYAKEVVKNSEWAVIKGSFIAKGGEKYVTIGNFFRDHEIQIEEIDPEAPRDFAYYYLQGGKFAKIKGGAVDVGPDLYVCKGNSIQFNSVYYSGPLTSPTWYPYPDSWINDRDVVNAIVSPEETTKYRLVFRSEEPEGCSVFDDLTVYVTDCSSCELNLDESQIYTLPVSCNQQNGLLTGVTFTGAKGDLRYEWRDAEGNVLPDEIESDLVNVAAGTYTLTAIDMIGCSVTQTFTIEEQTPLQVEINKQGVSCSGFSDGTAAVELSGGEGPFTYAWYDEGGNKIGTGTDLENLAAGNYKVGVMDIRGCTVESNFTISEPASLEVYAGEDELICSGDSVGLHAQLGGGAEDVFYSWAPSTGLSQTDIANPYAYPTTSTVYTVTIQKDNCTSTDQVEVLVEECPVECNLTINDSSVKLSPACDGLGGGIKGIEITGTYGNVVFGWRDADGNEVGTQADLQNVQAGTYYLSVTDEEGCEAAISKTVPFIDKQALEVHFSKDTVLCQGEVLSLNAALPDAQGFLWQDGSTNAEYLVQASGLYKVEIETPCGIVADSVKVLFKDCGLPVEIANALTPNGDGTNQVFYIKNIELYSDNELFIYNRWGNVVFHSKGYNNSWEGKYKGEELPVGTYYYVLYLDGKSKEQVYKGAVSIVK